MIQRILILSVVCIAIMSCAPRRGGGYYEDDGPPDHVPIDIAKLQDPVPRYEPRSMRGNDPYKALGRWYHPLKNARGYRERGAASWYGKKFHGKRTSSGEVYNMFAMTAAHRTLPLPTYVRVVNLRNRRSVTVRVNDRGPFLHNRLIDLSYAAAYKLGIIGTGTGLVEISSVTPGEFEAKPTAASRVPVRNTSFAAPRLFLQFGAFADRGNAERLRGRLRARGYEPAVDSISKNGLTLHRVRIGPLGGVSAADQIGGSLRVLGFDSQLVVE